MADKQSKDPGVRRLGQLALAMCLWVATFVGTSSRLTGRLNSLPLRVLLAVVAIGGFLPWVYVAGKAIIAENEFDQRLHLIAIAIAFALTGVAAYACGVLQRAGFIRDVPFGMVWMFMVVLWWISIMATARYHR